MDVNNNQYAQILLALLEQAQNQGGGVPAPNVPQQPSQDYSSILSAILANPSVPAQ